MTETRLFHVPVAGNSDDAVKHGLTLKAKCGLVWVPTITGGRENYPEIPDCPECHVDGPSRLPDRPHFVYRCYDRSDRLVYVGCSVAPRTRMEQHRASSWWFEQVQRIRYTVFPNKEYALHMERKAIEAENPRWNIRHRDRSEWGLGDYRDYHTALTFNGATEKRLERVRGEAQLHFGVDITDPEEMTA